MDLLFSFAGATNVGFSALLCGFACNGPGRQTLRYRGVRMPLRGFGTNGVQGEKAGYASRAG